MAVRVFGPRLPSGLSRNRFISSRACWMARVWSAAPRGQSSVTSSIGAGVAGGVLAATGAGGGGGVSSAMIRLNSPWASSCARSSSAVVSVRFRIWARWPAVFASADSASRFAWRSNSPVIANQASAAAGSLVPPSPCSLMSPSMNIEAAMPWRAAERSNWVAALTSRAVPLPSRSSSARLCLAVGSPASAALRYHSAAFEESRSTTKPRSYITPTLKADWTEPSPAARSSQPAPACGSFGMSRPWSRRRPSSSIAGISFLLARARNSSMAIVCQSVGLPACVAAETFAGGGAGAVVTGVTAMAGVGVATACVFFCFTGSGGGSMVTNASSTDAVIATIVTLARAPTLLRPLILRP